MRLFPGSRERHRPFRLVIALICGLVVTLDLAVVSVRYADVEFLGPGLGAIAIVLLPFLPYVLGFRSAIGSVLVGVGLLAAVIGSIVWLRFFATDPLEGLWLPFLTWVVALIGTALESAVFIPLELRRRTRVS